MEDMKFQLTDENGNIIDCKALHIFKHFNDNFLIYSDYTVNFDGNFNVYAAKFIIENEEIKFIPISDEEWVLINKEWSIQNEK